MTTKTTPDFFRVLAQFKRLLGQPSNTKARQFKYELPVSTKSDRTVNLDLFLPQKADYYRILAIRTGSRQLYANGDLVLTSDNQQDIIDYIFC